MIPVFQAAADLQKFCREREWPFCFIGALAVIRWGEPRATQDVDATILAGFGAEEPYIRELLEAFSARVDDAANFALVNRVLLLRASNGVDMDVSLAGLPFEESVVRRATPFEFEPGAGLVTCSAEDLVVLKAFAARDKDWLDVEGVLVRQPQLDWDYIGENLAPLCELKEAPEIMDRLDALRDRIAGL